MRPHEKSNADELQLEALGHKGELQRNFSFLSMLGLAFAILNSWTALSASMSLALPSGGSTSVIWGLITAGICNLCLAASLAEFLSAYPTAGGQWVACFKVMKTKLMCQIPLGSRHLLETLHASAFVDHRVDQCFWLDCPRCKRRSARVTTYHRRHSDVLPELRSGALAPVLDLYRVYVDSILDQCFYECRHTFFIHLSLKHFLPTRKTQVFPALFILISDRIYSHTSTRPQSHGQFAASS